MIPASNYWIFYQRSLQIDNVHIPHYFSIKHDQERSLYEYTARCLENYISRHETTTRGNSQDNGEHAENEESRYARQNVNRNAPKLYMLLYLYHVLHENIILHYCVRALPELFGLC